jgi:hypothetical protein
VATMRSTVSPNPSSIWASMSDKSITVSELPCGDIRLG